MSTRFSNNSIRLLYSAGPIMADDEPKEVDNGYVLWLMSKKTKIMVGNNQEPVSGLETPAHRNRRSNV